MAEIRKARFVALVLAGLMAGAAFAQAPIPAAEPLPAITAGPTIPLSPYYSYLISGEDQAGVMEGLAFPMVSALKPARLMGAPQVLDAKWLTRPMFLMGDDARSIEWLKRHAPALRRADASGVVLAAASTESFKAVQRIASDHQLDVAPGPDRWLESQLVAQGAAVLPLYIGLDGRAAQSVPGEAPDALKPKEAR